MKINVTGADEAATILARLAAQGRNLSPAFKVFGQYKERQIKLGFDAQRDPDGNAWQPLSPKTLDRKKRKLKSLAILREEGDLRGSITYDVTARSLVVGSTENSPKPAVHQFGTSRAGRGRKTRIPARPWLGFTRQDETELIATIAEHFDVF